MKTSTFIPPQAHKFSQRLDALDGLRGIAIALVVWFHLWQVSWLDPYGLIFFPISGFLGVELFFFLSAFCLSYPYVRAHLAGESPPGLRHFAYRRFIKIVPSYVLSMIVVIALAALPGTKDSWAENIPWTNVQSAVMDILAHLTFVHTFFAETYASINGVLWTLGIEVQFYVLLPFLMVPFLLMPAVTGLGMAAIALAYRLLIAQCCREPLFDHNLGQLFGFFDFFAAGMLTAYAYCWLETRRPDISARKALWTIAALGAAVWIVLLFENLTAHRWEEQFASWWLVHNGTFYAMALSVLCLGSLFALPVWRVVLANRIFVFLAVISYNLYLWHQVVFRWVATWPFIPHAPGVTRGDPTWAWLVTLCGLALAVGVATLVTYAIERPLLRMEPGRLARMGGSWVSKTAALR